MWNLYNKIDGMHIKQNMSVFSFNASFMFSVAYNTRGVVGTNQDRSML